MPILARNPINKFGWLAVRLSVSFFLLVVSETDGCSVICPCMHTYQDGLQVRREEHRVPCERGLD